MNAHELYELLVGEIGIERGQFYFVLPFWEISAIVTGYRKRERTLCDLTRWQTFWIMNCIGDPTKAGIYNPSDLLSFPWDKEREERPMSEDEEQRIREELQRINRKNVNPS